MADGVLSASEFSECESPHAIAKAIRAQIITCARRQHILEQPFWRPPAKAPRLQSAPRDELCALLPRTRVEDVGFGQAAAAGLQNAVPHRGQPFGGMRVGAKSTIGMPCSWPPRRRRRPGRAARGWQFSSRSLPCCLAALYTASRSMSYGLAAVDAAGRWGAPCRDTCGFARHPTAPLRDLLLAIDFWP